jgi:hypothetical protein
LAVIAAVGIVPGLLLARVVRRSALTPGM